MQFDPEKIINKICASSCLRDAGLFLVKTGRKCLRTVKKELEILGNTVRKAYRKKDYRILVPTMAASAAAVVLLVAGVISLGAGGNGKTAPFVPKADQIQEQASGETVLLNRADGAADTIKAAVDRLSQNNTLKGFVEQTGNTVQKIKEQGQQALRENYMKILDSGQGDSYDPGTGTRKSLWEEVRAQRKEELKKDPYLLLVNKWHYLPDDYETEPVTLPNWQTIGSDCYEPLMRMLDDCTAAGGTPIVCSGYRPHWHQVNLFDAQIDRWLNLGYGYEDARELASTAVAIPGTSEHELGLAADIYSSENMDLDESQIYTFTQQWLMENCWRYGFILRYPQDKSEITGIIFEPWHYRYVGKEHAKKIWDAGICLEEYLDETSH